MHELTCPRCNVALQRLKSANGWIHACQECQGRSVALPVLRERVGREVALEAWRLADESDSLSCKCPACARPMTLIHLPLGAVVVDIDVCKSCRTIWFDRLELEQLPVDEKTKKASSEKEKSQSSKEAIAKAQVRLMSEESEAKEFGIARPTIDSPLGGFMGFFR
jgi:Zn-finger nucleic acid-binding protein